MYAYRDKRAPIVNKQNDVLNSGIETARIKTCHNNREESDTGCIEMPAESLRVRPDEIICSYKRKDGNKTPHLVTK